MLALVARLAHQHLRKLAAFYGRHEIVMTTNMEITDKNLRYGFALAAVNHFVKQSLISAHFDFAIAQPHAGQRLFGRFAIGAVAFGVNFNLRHGHYLVALCMGYFKAATRTIYAQ